jgi:hypothetical protein
MMLDNVIGRPMFNLGFRSLKLHGGLKKLRAVNFNFPEPYQAGSPVQIALNPAAANVNLAPIPNVGDVYGGNGNYWDYYDVDPNSWTADCHLDTTMLHNGHPSLRIDPTAGSSDPNTARELDGSWLNISPGQNFLASAWIYAGDSTTGDTYGGGRLGCDYYAHTSTGYGIVDGLPGDALAACAYVVFGTNTWTQRIWNAIIPSTSYTKNWTNNTTCNPVQIDSFVLWFQIWGLNPSTEKGLCWFADSTLYVSPTGPMPHSTCIGGSAQ